MSFGSEILTGLLNETLLEKQNLFLPKIIDNELKLFKIKDLQRDLTKHRFGFLEPKDTLEQVPIQVIETILVPALSFDHTFNRIGYGKGYYDRLLIKALHTKSIGLIYREQLSNIPLPTDLWDQSVKLLYIF